MTSDPFATGIRQGEPYKLYLLSNDMVIPMLDPRPFGIPLTAIDFRKEHFEFRNRQYQVLDLLALFRSAHSLSVRYPQLVLPRWMIVDLALMPSGLLLAVAGQDHVASVARALERDGPNERAARLRDLLQIASRLDDGTPIPVAGFAAAPTTQVGRWVGGSLWWSLIPGEHLGYTVRRVALACYRASTEIGVTQYDNAPALAAQSKFGRLRITKTHLSAHPVPHTFAYEVDLTGLPANGDPAAASESTEVLEEIDLDHANIDDKLAEIQRDIDKGARYYLRPPSRTGSGRRVICRDEMRPAGQEQLADRWWFTQGISGTEKYTVCVISNAAVLAGLNLSPFGFKLEHIDFTVDQFRLGNSTAKYEVQKLLDLIRYANNLSYAESGLGMSEWGMVELAIMPSAIVLALANQDVVEAVAAKLRAAPAGDLRRESLVPLSEDDRDRLHDANALRDLLDRAARRGYQGPLPVAGYAAVPTPRRGYWIGWSMWSLVPGERLGYTMKRIALACFGVETLGGVTQFRRSRGLDVNSKFGDTEITNALVQAHPAKDTFTYQINVADMPADGRPRRAARLRAPKMILDPGDKDLDRRLRDIQGQIEHGARYYILPRSTTKTISPRIPITWTWTPYRRLAFFAWSRAQELRSFGAVLRRRAG
jgi:hypothetical protein